MKRWMELACAVLCVLALALVGCANTNVRGDVAGEKARGATGEHAPELNQALVKHWNLSRTEQDGLTVWNKDDDDVLLTLRGNGSARIWQVDVRTVYGSWEASDFDDITFYEEGSDIKGKRYKAHPMTYDPDANELHLDASAWHGEGTLCFTDGIKVGTERGITYPKSADLTDIEDASVLVGDWELYWAKEDDAVAEGEADKVAAWLGRKSGTLTLAEGGKGTFLGDEVEWWLDKGFATMIVVDGAGKHKRLDIRQLTGGIMVTSAEDGAHGFCYQFARPK